MCCNSNEQPVTKIDTAIPAKEKELRDAVAQYPDSAKLKLDLINYFEQNGNFEMAIAEASNAIKSDSLNTLFYDKKAVVQFEDGDTAGAIKTYEKAINIFPDPVYIQTLGLFYAYKKDSNALVMSDALLMAPKAMAEKEALIIRAIYYNGIRQYKKSLQAAEQCLAISYTYLPAYREKAITLYDMANYNEAINTLEKAITLNNKFEEGYFLLGKNYEKLENRAAAIESYQTALMYDPDYTDAKEALAKLGVK